MSTLHRLKAYFGMVPADELDDYGHDEYGDYADYADQDRGYGDRAGARRRWADRPDRSEHDDYYDDEPEVPVRRQPAPPRRNWAAETPVRGSLAMDPAREVSVRTAPAPVVEDVHPMSRITTLHPSSFVEARTIGEHYREGVPVIMNLTAMEDADARRLVDFAAGLAFALRGSIDKVTTKVFLISPANVDVTAEDRRRIAEGSFLPPHFNHS